MLAIIIRALGFVFAIWLVRRLLNVISGSHRAGREKDKATNPSSHMVKDPVCGMYMDSRLAVRLENKREDFYFCSEECKKKYIGNAAGMRAAGPPA